ncbi:hypothetical protein, partial [Mycolicibacterium palauense]|uniref:hypothetical protein n=1 Tax=Mycolicibacterium palauense TaxID=2034511 RepID=UPI001145FDD1
NGANGAQNPTQPDYGAPAGWQAPGWPPQHPQQGYWYPPPQGRPDGDSSPRESSGEESGRTNPPAHG